MAQCNPVWQLGRRARRCTGVNRPLLNVQSSKIDAGLRLSSRTMATVVPPVTQDSTGAKGPTAMVFMNMGGPSTTDEVGDFLSRLFVRLMRAGSSISEQKSNCVCFRPMEISYPLVACSHTSDPLSPVDVRPRSRSSMLPSVEALPSANGQNISQGRCVRSWTEYHRRLPHTSLM